jgi:hypothetical protein
VEALKASWPAELDQDDQNGQNQLRSRLARFLGARGSYVREVVAVLREASMRRRKP